MKKAIILFVFISVLLAPLSSASPQDGNVITDPAPISASLDFKRTIGIEIEKPARNILRVVDGNTAVNIDSKTFYDDVNALTEINLLDFGTPTFDVDGNMSNANTPSFKVVYDIETAGTLLVFFSSKNDLGWYDEKGKGYYQNPYMMMSVEGKGLNYQVHVTGKSKLNDTKQKDPADADVTYTNGNDWHASITTKNVLFLDNAFPPEFIKPYTCLVFARRMLPAPVATGMKAVEGARGVDKYELSLLPQGNNIYEAGLYSGYVVVHFTTNV